MIRRWLARVRIRITYRLRGMRYGHTALTDPNEPQFHPVNGDHGEGR